ncbi:hypothetical protein FD754_001492, partial [Muntiacus muntjak]
LKLVAKKYWIIPEGCESLKNMLYSLIWDLSLFWLGLCLSRASASVLNLNCSLILLPMCRTLLAYLRGSQKVPSRRTRRLLDKSRTFHITCGMTICIFSGVHVAAHLVNALNFSANYREDFVELNAARYREEDPRKLLFTTVPGLTGVCMVLVLFLMITASTYAIRGLLKYQTNLDTHPPGCMNLNGTHYQNTHLPEHFSEHFHESSPGGFSKPDELTQNMSVKICMEEPRFQANFPQTWLWISGPLCLYCAERLYRCIRSNKPVTIISVTSHPSDVMEIRMVKENFKARPGQYIILHCPSVSALENHPFTLTMLSVIGIWAVICQFMLASVIIFICSMMLLKCCTQYVNMSVNLENSLVVTGLEKVRFHSNQLICLLKNLYAGGWERNTKDNQQVIVHFYCPILRATNGKLLVPNFCCYSTLAVCCLTPGHVQRIPISKNSVGLGHNLESTKNNYCFKEKFTETIKMYFQEIYAIESFILFTLLSTFNIVES